MINVLKLVLLLSGIIINAAAFSQLIISGKISDNHNREPIAYANIGISNRSIGTISNKDGSFLLNLSEIYLKDTVVFTSLGFADAKIPVKYFREKKAYNIYLRRKTNTLPEIIVTKRKEKKRWFQLGNNAVSAAVLKTDSTYAGCAFAVLIENKEPVLQKDLKFPAYLENARLKIFRNNLSSFKFRLRINEVDAVTGKPGKDMLEESIVVESSMRKGWIKFDLSHLNFEVTKPFFVTFEQIIDLEDRIKIVNGYNDFIKKYPKKLRIDTVEVNGNKEVRRILHGGIDLPGTFIAISNSPKRKAIYTTYERETSMSEWQRAAIFTATVSLSNQDTSTRSNENFCDKSDLACQALTMTKEFMDEAGINGLQIAVSRQNKLIWSASSGYSDVQNKKQVTDSTLFMINSISKSVTSLALIKLVEEGKIDLDAPIQKYLPEYPLKPYPFTIRQLAGHTAGFRDYKEDDPADYIRHQHYNSAKDAMKIFENDSLLFEPGSEFSYSTFGWNLIGAVIESVTGESYVAYMRKHIWDPMKLSNTMEDDIQGYRKTKSKYYDASGEEINLGDLSYKYAGGGLLSTSMDLLKIGNEILFGNYLTTAQKESLFKSFVTKNGVATGYGLGWYIGNANGQRIWYHGGDSFGGSSFLVIYPDSGVVLSFLSNSQAGIYFPVHELAALFLK